MKFLLRYWCVTLWHFVSVSLFTKPEQQGLLPGAPNPLSHRALPPPHQTVTRGRNGFEPVRRSVPVQVIRVQVFSSHLPLQRYQCRSSSSIPTRNILEKEMPQCDLGCIERMWTRVGGISLSWSVPPRRLAIWSKSSPVYSWRETWLPCCLENYL